MEYSLYLFIDDREWYYWKSYKTEEGAMHAFRRLKKNFKGWIELNMCRIKSNYGITYYG